MIRQIDVSSETLSEFTYPIYVFSISSEYTRVYNYLTCYHPYDSSHTMYIHIYMYIGEN